jgi:hypothetical protein
MANDEPRLCATTGCGKKLRSDNTKGICGDCQASGRKAAAPAGTKNAEAAPRQNVRAAPAKPAKKSTAPRVVKARKGTRVAVKIVATDIDELLERREDLEAELAEVDAALQTALAASKAKVERLEAAIRAAVESARVRKVA